MKSKNCAYCKRELGNNLKRTAEHIFPQVLMELFPEQDVSFTPEKVFKDNSGLTIADVCYECNNGPLSVLDGYGGSLIKNEFMGNIDYDFKDSEIEKSIKYETFSKWIVKIAYNYLRSRKKNCFFFEQYIPSIIRNERIPEYFDIFVGLHINTAPVPEICYEYKPLQIVEEPRLFGTSLWISMLYNLPSEWNEITVPGTECTLLMRFGNAIIYVVFWNNEINAIVKDAYRKLLVEDFNFAYLKPEKEKYKLKRVTASTNISMGYWHILSKSALLQDDRVIESMLNGKNPKETQQSFNEKRSDSDWKRSRLLVEKEMFPDNKKVNKEFEKFFGKEK